MKKKTISISIIITFSSLALVTLISLGSALSQNTHNLQAGRPIMTSYNNIHNSDSGKIGIPAKIFYSVFVDNNNYKWFLTELGIISFTGEKWVLHNENNKVSSKDLKDFAYGVNPDGPELWLASPNGATVVRLPISSGSDATTFLSDNSPILSNNVVKLTTGNGPIRWFGTDKGISALSNNKWLTPDYEDIYPGMMFHEFPITSMATNKNGDSLYVGTRGAGVARIFKDEVDGISGASVYAKWGPIILPSDNICSIFIAPDGAKWFGTDSGIARHSGNNTLENWTVFTTEDGLVDNYVQAITADNRGNFWFGTRGGISVFNGSSWNSYTTNNGLISSNVLCLAVDRDGIVWIGTDNGVTSYNNGEFVSYK